MRFISEYSFAYLLPILLLAGLATWYFVVRGNPLTDLPKLAKRSVYMLRFLLLTLIGILLLGLLFEYKRIDHEKPVLITIFDNSSSLLNYKDSASVKGLIKGLQKDMDLQFDERYERVNYLIGNDFRKGKELNFADNKTDLAQGFESIFSTYYNRNIGGIILVSDGNFNQGQSPQYAAAKIPLTPVFTLGVGDTIAKRDQLIKDVIANELAFLKNKFPVEIDLEAFKMGKGNSTVSIYHDGKKVASQQVAYTDGIYDSKQVLFELEANQPGFQQYVVEISGKEGEYTLKNNRRSFYIEVLDSRNKILILSAAPHPDVSALKSVLEQDENIQVQSFLLEKWDKNLKNTDLLIWHEPGQGFSEALNQQLMESKVPILYFIGANTSNAVIQKLGIGLSYSSSSQMDEVQAGLSSGFDLFELSEELKQEIQKFPPVKTKFGVPKLGNQNTVFLTQRLVNIQKKDALFFFGSDDNRKYGVFLGDGIWKWKLMVYQKYQSAALFNEFIQKTNQYLVQRKNSSNLRVSLPKRFLKNENVLIKAEFYNEAMELITKPNISFNLLDSKGKKSVFEFGVNGNLYLLPLGKLKPGTYSWTAQTSFSGKKYIKRGNFVVEDIQIEKLDTRANHGLLGNISQESNGKFYPLKAYKLMIKDIQSREDITSVAFEQSSFTNLHDYFLLLLLLLLIAASEWFIKRWYGYY